MSWQKAPQGQLSEHFSFQEAACRCCGRVVAPDTIKNTAAMMELIRKQLGSRPVKVLSWCRCPQYNARVGGAENSFHTKGMAVDFVVKHLTPGEVQVNLKEHTGGLGRYPGFTHADWGPKRRWTG